MAENATKTRERPTDDQDSIASATTDIVTQMARSAAGELVKGNQPFNQVARKVVGEAVETLDERGPELAKRAGIMTWRYAVLGWATWNIGKRVARRKASSATHEGTKGGHDNGAEGTS